MPLFHLTSAIRRPFVRYGHYTVNTCKPSSDSYFRGLKAPYKTMSQPVRPDPEMIQQESLKAWHQFLALQDKINQTSCSKYPQLYANLDQQGKEYIQRINACLQEAALQRALEKISTYPSDRPFLPIDTTNGFIFWHTTHIHDIEGFLTTGIDPQEIQKRSRQPDATKGFYMGANTDLTSGRFGRFLCSFYVPNAVWQDKQVHPLFDTTYIHWRHPLLRHIRLLHIDDLEHPPLELLNESKKQNREESFFWGFLGGLPPL